MSNLSFIVAPRLAELHSESYSSTELALRELVDNAWDADADRVEITLPEPMTPNPIIIKDNGSGITPEDLNPEEDVSKVKRRLDSTANKSLKKLDPPDTQDE